MTESDRNHWHAQLRVEQDKDNAIALLRFLAADLPEDDELVVEAKWKVLRLRERDEKRARGEDNTAGAVVRIASEDVGIEAVERAVARYSSARLRPAPLPGRRARARRECGRRTQRTTSARGDPDQRAPLAAALRRRLRWCRVEASGA